METSYGESEVQIQTNVREGRHTTSSKVSDGCSAGPSRRGGSELPPYKRKILTEKSDQLDLCDGQIDRRNPVLWKTNSQWIRS